VQKAVFRYYDDGVGAQILKGAVGNLCAAAAFDATGRLEMIGRQAGLACAEKAHPALDTKIQRLRSVVTGWVEETLA
jgi:hypothetical protein